MQEITSFFAIDFRLRKNDNFTAGNDLLSLDGSDSII